MSDPTTNPPRPHPELTTGEVSYIYTSRSHVLRWTPPGHMVVLASPAQDERARSICLHRRLADAAALGDAWPPDAEFDDGEATGDEDPSDAAQNAPGATIAARGEPEGGSRATGARRGAGPVDGLAVTRRGVVMVVAVVALAIVVGAWLVGGVG